MNTYSDAFSSCYFSYIHQVSQAQKEERLPVVWLKDSTGSADLTAFRVSIVDSIGNILSSGSINSSGFLRIRIPQQSNSARLYLLFDDTSYFAAKIPFDRLLDTVPVWLPRRVKALANLTVVGRQNPLREDARGAELDLTKIKEGKRWTLREILQKIPGLQIDATGKGISYMGRDIAIVKDGVSVAGFEAMIKNSLNNTTAEDYDKISLNLYDLKLEKPTLSFITHKYREGIWGNLGGMAGTNMTSLMPAVSYSKRKHLFNLTSQTSLMYFPDNTVNRELVIETSGNATKESSNQNGNTASALAFGISDSYNISVQQTLNLSFQYKLSSSAFDMLTTSDETRDDTLFSSTVLEYTNHSSFKGNHSITGNAGYTYRPKDRKNATSRFDASLEWIRSSTTLNSRSNAVVLKGEMPPHSNFRNTAQDGSDYLFGLIGYEYKHKKAGNFEGVLKYFNRNFNAALDFLHERETNSTDSLIVQEYGVNYRYAALLMSWEKAFKNFSMRAIIKGDKSADVISGETVRDRFDFITFSPYISLFRKIGNGSVRFEAKYYQKRPSLKAMSSIVNYGEQYGFDRIQVRGNPTLHPSGALDLSVIGATRFKGIDVNSFMRFTYATNEVAQYLMVIDSAAVRTYRNLASSYSYNTSISASFFPFTRFSVQLSARGIWGRYKADAEHNHESTFMLTPSLNLSYSINPAWRVTSGANYSGGTSFMRKTQGMLFSNIAVAYTRNRFALTLLATNVHRPYNTSEYINYGEGFTQTFRTRSRLLMLNMSINYRFGNVLKQANKGKDIIKDDM